MKRPDSEIEQDVAALTSLNARRRISATEMDGGKLQWRIWREGYKPCFISLTTGAVTQGGNVTKARGLAEALALLGVVL